MDKMSLVSVVGLLLVLLSALTGSSLLADSQPLRQSSVSESQPAGLGAAKFTLFFEDFQQVAPPLLPEGWRNLLGAGIPWVTTTNSPPNSKYQRRSQEMRAPANRSLSPPRVAVFAPALDRSVASLLYSPLIRIGSNSTRLSFRHSFNFQKGIDGAALEISISGKTFEDIENASGIFLNNGYNATLQSGSELAGRLAWTGDSGGYIVTRVELPATAGGQTVQLCWRCATDERTGGDGWYIDDIEIEEVRHSKMMTGPRVVRTHIDKHRFVFSFDTVVGRNYVVEFRNVLDDSHWQIFETISGDGTEKTEFAPHSIDTGYFYRVRVE